jgi:23S rRNA pseudouridine2605 synthase
VIERGLKKTLVEVRLREGRKRQIRNMFEKAGCPVLRLRRICFGPLALGGLEEGSYRKLSRKELRRLMSALGIDRG